MDDPKRTPGQPGIPREKYHEQIRLWQRTGEPLAAITATRLQKAVGGNFEKVKTILAEYLDKTPAPVAVEYPAQLTATVNAAAAAIWATIEQEAARAQAKVDQTTLEAIQAAEVAQHAAEEAETLARAQAEQLTAQVKQLTAQLKKAQGQGDDLARKVESLQGVNTELSANLQSVSADKGRYMAESKRCRTEFERLSQAHEAQAGQLLDAEKRVSVAESAQTQTERHLADLQALFQQLSK